jgi:hypothetical protein
MVGLARGDVEDLRHVAELKKARRHVRSVAR